MPSDRAADVTVVVAVYNTMPYLTTCLNSLVEQSIGHDRMEVVAVDDGSTDGGGAELDRFAEEYPDLFTVLRQPNSGGPAGPSNRALDVATGRYVYFVGADDHLGPEALERMVAAADTWGSDVLVGKMEGVNGRTVDQALFTEDQPDLDLFDSALPFLLSNCKLFRRALVDGHRLRFPEDMRIYSDQPFTIEACVRASRISVLASYTCYYAVLRGDDGNITQGAVPVPTLVECTERLLEFVGGLLEPGPRRDAIVHRYAKWELTNPIRQNLLELDDDMRAEVCARVGSLVDRFVTDEVLARLPVPRRVRLRLAQRGQVDRLCEAIRADVAGRAFSVTLKKGRAYLGYDGFEDPGANLPDDLYALTEPVRWRLRRAVLSVGAKQAGNRLEVTVHTLFTGPDAEDTAFVGLVLTRAGVREHVDGTVLTGDPGGAGTTVTARILPPPAVSGKAKYTLRLAVRTNGEQHDLTVPAAGLTAVDGIIRHRARLYRVSVRGDANGATVIMMRGINPASAAARRVRRAASLGGR